MNSDSRDERVITEEKAEMIQERKENFQTLAEEAQSSNRFQLVVAGFAASLLAVLEGNGIVTAQQLLSESRFTILALCLFSVCISTSFIIFHSAKKRASQQSKLLFDDVLYERYSSEEELEKRFSSDTVQESILRWMLSLSVGGTVVTIFFFIFGILEIHITIGPVVYLVSLLLILGGVAVYGVALLLAMIESVIGELREYWRKKNISEKLKQRIGAYFRRKFSIFRSKLSSFFP